jgi:hypothetical protein
MRERADISARGLALGAAVVLAGIVFSLAAAALLAARVAAPATGASRGAPPAIEGAVLQTAPQQDLAAFLREKQARLESYGPVDAQHVHIPIEQAMRLLSQGRGR